MSRQTIPSRLYACSCLLIFALSFSCSTSNRTPQSKTTLIFLTTFEPFGKWRVNLTNDVANKITKIKSQIGENIQIEICRLPVEYDLAAKKALQCLSGLPRNPDLAVTLGEGKCSILLETAATNIDHTPNFADNAGIIRTMSPIVPSADRRIAFTLPVDEMFCSLPSAEKDRVALSVSAGNYVCNNTAFHLIQHFKEKRVPYGIIHIPHSGCTEDMRDTTKNAHTIAHFLSVALQSNNKNTTVIPASEEQVVNLLSKRSPHSESTCRTDFLNQLLNKYEEAKKKTALKI